MKGRVSPALEKVLKDPEGREQLKSHLLMGKDGRIVTTDKTYALKVDVTTLAKVTPKTR